MKYITFFLLLTIQMSFAQTNSIDTSANEQEIKVDTLKAVFDWITDNISYDIDKNKQLKDGVNFYQEGEYKSVEKYRADLLEMVIKNKSGICYDYSILFDATAKKFGYESHIIKGITKRKGGEVNEDISHTWNAVKVSGIWRLYDSTWGAGYVKDGTEFIKKYNVKWYNISPETLRETHLPYDPMWQLSSNPITYHNFEEGTQTESELVYDFDSIITQHLTKDEVMQLEAELGRIENYGGDIKLINNRKDYLQRSIDYKKVSLIYAECKKASSMYNEYRDEGRKKEFKGEKWTLQFSESVVMEILDILRNSIIAFENIKVVDPKEKEQIKDTLALSRKRLRIAEKQLKMLRRKINNP